MESDLACEAALFPSHEQGEENTSVRSICIVRLTPASAEMISDGTRPEGARDSDAPHRASSARGEPATVALKALEVRARGIHEEFTRHERDIT